jgi:hypothetical protein
MMALSHGDERFIRRFANISDLEGKDQDYN